MDMRRIVLWIMVFLCNVLSLQVLPAETEKPHDFRSEFSNEMQDTVPVFIAPIFDANRLALIRFSVVGESINGSILTQNQINGLFNACGNSVCTRAKTKLFLQLIAGIIYKIVYLDTNRGRSNDAHNCMVRCANVIGSLSESTNMRALLQGQGGLPALLGALTHEERTALFRELTNVSSALAEANGHFFCSSSTVTIAELQENIIAAMAHGAGSRCAQSTAMLGAGLMLVALCTEFGRSLIGKIFEGGMHFAAWLFGWQADAAACAVAAESMRAVGAWCGDHPIIAATVLIIGGVVAAYSAINTLYEAGTLTVSVLVHNKGFAPIAVPEKTNRTVQRPGNGKVLEGNAYDFLRANTSNDAALRPIKIGPKQIDQRWPQPFLNYLPNIAPGSEGIE